jgi:hypothetical protein
MDPETKIYTVFEPDETRAKKSARQAAYDEGFIGTRILRIEKFGVVDEKRLAYGRFGSPVYKWLVSMRLDSRRANHGNVSATWTIPIGAIVETVKPTVYVRGRKATPMPPGARGKVLGRTGGLLRVRLDGLPTATLLSADQVRVVAYH